MMEVEYVPIKFSAGWRAWPFLAGYRLTAHEAAGLGVGISELFDTEDEAVQCCRDLNSVDDGVAGSAS